MIKKTILSIVLILVGAWGFTAIAGEQGRRESSHITLRSVETTLTPEELAAALAAAIVTPLTATSCLTDVSSDGVVTQGAVFTSPPSLQGFPTDTGSFAVLSSGIAANTPGEATDFESTDMVGVDIPASDPLGSPDGFISHDAVTLTLTFALPANPGVLTFKWKFGTEENPQYLESNFQDYFRADVDTSAGVFNIARLPDLSPVTVDNANAFSNSPGGTDSENPDPPFPSPNDVVYNSVTTTIATATKDLSFFGEETITLALRVADANDTVLDSAAFIDSVTIEGCEAALPTQTSKRDIVETGSSTCPIEILVDDDGCATDIVPDGSCPPSVVEKFAVQIGAISGTDAAVCEGNASFPGSFRYCYPNAAGSMTCITF